MAVEGRVAVPLIECVYVSDSVLCASGRCADANAGTGAGGRGGTPSPSPSRTTGVHPIRWRRVVKVPVRTKYTWLGLGWPSCNTTGPTQEVSGAHVCNVRMPQTQARTQTRTCGLAEPLERRGVVRTGGEGVQSGGVRVNVSAPAHQLPHPLRHNCTGVREGGRGQRAEHGDGDPDSDNVTLRSCLHHAVCQCIRTHTHTHNKQTYTTNRHTHK